ncbi:DUF397 domain-containing protein [Micromonospora sp. WMMD961]|uniref:DUF397 domain-containing protein n=1 Tax=unclassified Micromonospora TaxID=2617518 RepID=UPI0022B69D6D|nr:MULTISPECIES: DUF397 domain-containing protein [unclassified Micromonospora]MCZ7378849.1 DUF397 domain-containing protein [Micromonospora sp. WMMC250]MDG4783384.1 DUF397 domain-containing protein [Micromonospora sp. WMMD961]
MTTLDWKKSTRSNGGGDCVEVAAPPQVVMVRDSKDRQGPVLSFNADQWAGFVRGVKAGKFDA